MGDTNSTGPMTGKSEAVVNWNKDCTNHETVSLVSPCMYYSVEMAATRKLWSAHTHQQTQWYRLHLLTVTVIVYYISAVPVASSNVISQWLSSGADPEGGAGGARPPLFAPYSLKSPLNWSKNLGGEPPNPLRPSFFKSWIRPGSSSELHT